MTTTITCPVCNQVLATIQLPANATTQDQAQAAASGYMCSQDQAEGVATGG